MVDGMMFKGTPGPWKFGVRKDKSIWLSLGDPIKGPHHQGDFFGTEDDARLTTAAPELLEALMPTMNLAMWTESAADDELVIMSVGTIRKMRAAIAKALGEQE